MAFLCRLDLMGATGDRGTGRQRQGQGQRKRQRQGGNAEAQGRRGERRHRCRCRISLSNVGNREEMGRGFVGCFRHPAWHHREVSTGCRLPRGTLPLPIRRNQRSPAGVSGDFPGRASLPPAANGSWASGNPFALGEIRTGEHVLDLGCGAGLDTFIAAQLVGSQGRVVGVDPHPAACRRKGRPGRDGNSTVRRFARPPLRRCLFRRSCPCCLQQWRSQT